MAPIATGDLSELSTVIGELRSFASQQNLTNAHMLDELKKISDRLGATFMEYRKTLHERFGKIHEQIGSIDTEMERMQMKVDGIKGVMAEWRGQMRTLVWLFGVGGTLIASLLSTWGSVLLRMAAFHIQ